jgi:predicted hotdog family 3-hydroxylacyl-ACP dehydratase
VTPYPPIVELVPHRPPMLLLDRVLSYDGERVVCETVLEAGSPFVEQGRVPAVVGIEYMAQAAAAFAGIEQVQRGEAASIGLLIGSRYYSCMLETFPFGTPLVVEVRLALRDEEDFAAYRCALSAHSQPIAECTLKAYRPRDIRPFLPKPGGAGG